MLVQSALGRYAHAVTAGVVLVILASWAAVHVGDAFGLVVAGVNTTQLDTFALAAFTYLLGNVSALNGVRPEVIGAHRRLDAMGAPTADVAERIVNAANGATDTHGVPRGGGPTP